MQAIVTVVHPTQRVDESAADLSEIKSWRVEYKAQAAQQWSQLGGARTPDYTTANVDNLTAGVYDFRVFWTDTYDQESDPAATTYDTGAPAKLAPGAISVAKA